MMEGEDPRNDALVMNARRESIYGIRKKNRMYPPSRMCPACGGYDIVNSSAPFKCHDCGRSFGHATGQTEADGEQGRVPVRPETRPMRAKAVSIAAGKAR
jgi:hypothetical protein